MNEPFRKPAPPVQAEDAPSVLDRTLARRVDEALCQVGSYGEVRLVVVKGRVRFIQIVRSEDVGAADPAREPQ